MLAAATLLAAPALVSAADRRILHFVPHTNLAVLDPFWSDALVTRNHALLVFDTLFGQEDALSAWLQMVGGAIVSKESRRWTLRLGDGLHLHGGEPVLAPGCVASQRCWVRRDPFAVTDELLADGDRAIIFWLNRPLLHAAGCFGRSHRLSRADDAAVDHREWPGKVDHRNNRQ